MLALLSLCPVRAEWTPSDQPNQPVGQGKGIFPGRVVWLHDPQAAAWDGRTGAWYEDKNTDPPRANALVSDSIRLLASAERDDDAWTAIFRHFNRTHGRGNNGYQAGEKIIVKVNLNTSSRHKSDADADGSVGLYNTPQATVALVRQLVKQAGVPETDITLYDASRIVSDAMYLPIHREFPGVRFKDRDGGGGRERVQPDRKAAVHFADPTIQDNDATYLPRCVTAATYMVNLAVMKGHDLAAVTLCAKNHFGSIYRDREVNSLTKGWSPANLHESISVRERPMGSYNSLVDLMGHKDLGGKTVLYMVDALYAAPRQQEVGPVRWNSAPFNEHWTASIFVSQDPVALESVALDFFRAETAIENVTGAADNYLHEAAQADKPPSGVRYDPENDGTTLTSLGVHEHWNNATQRRYSRNSGKNQGIELVTAEGK